MQKITLLGATGSIGTNALDVIRRANGAYKVYALTAYSNLDLLLKQVAEFTPEFVVVPKDKAKICTSMLKNAGLSATGVLVGEAGLIEVASTENVDIVLSAIVGAAGLVPTMAAVDAGKKILLANKESLVMAGDLLMQRAKATGALVLPVDSEHNAIFQSKPYGKTLAEAGIVKLILTASGGPFFGWSKKELAQVKAEDAINHPTWNMGAKISVDSATLMNKGLELIEAARLFDAKIDELDTIIHRQSWLHCLVVYKDGSTLSEINAPDMRIHIASALAYPHRLDLKFDLPKLAGLNLTFDTPDEETFRCLKLAKQSLVAGNEATIILNAANEMAVATFLQNKISFLNIATIVEECLSQVNSTNTKSLEDILELDRKTREFSKALIAKSF